MMADPRILVAMGAPMSPSSPTTVILGLTDATWNDLAGGRAQDIDLRSLGVPAVLLVMRGRDHPDVIRQLEETAAALDIPTGKLGDLSFTPPKAN